MIDGYRLIYHLAYMAPLVFAFTTLRWFHKQKNRDLNPVIYANLIFLIFLIIPLQLYPNPFGWINGTLAIFLYAFLGLLLMILYNQKLHNGLISFNLALLSIGACRDIYEIGWWIHTDRFIDFLGFHSLGNPLILGVRSLGNPLIINSSLVALIILAYALRKLKWAPNHFFYISCLCFVSWSFLWAIYGLETIVRLTCGSLPRIFGMLLFISLPYGIPKVIQT